MKTSMPFVQIIFTSLFISFFSCGEDKASPTPMSTGEATFLSYSLSGQVGSATISSTSKTIVVLFPKESDVTQLIATFSTSPNSAVFIGDTPQVSSQTPNDFSSPVHYKVMSEDGNTVENWVVNVKLTTTTIMVSTFIESFPGNDELSIDREGNIYVNSSGSNGNLDGRTAYKVTPDGNYSLYADNLPLWPVGSILDVQGNLFITGWQAGIIVRISKDDGSKSTVATGVSGAGSIDIDGAGNILAAEYNTSSVLRISPSGSKSVYSSGGSLQNPAGLTVDDASGNVYVSNWTNGSVSEITVTGVAERFVTLPVASVGPIKSYKGFLYACSPKFHKIFKIDISTKEVSVFAGTGRVGHKDGGLAEATFDTPTGIGTIDGKTFYVAETFSGKGRLRVIKVEE